MATGDKDNRRKKERRRWDVKPSFPLVDSDGNIVTKNRRRVLDRRSEVDLAAMTPQEDQSSAPHSNIVNLSLRYNGEVMEFRKPDSEIRIGRSSDSAIVINGKHTSRYHASLTLANNKISLTDHSTNGTYVKFSDGRTDHIKDQEVDIKGTGIISVGKPIMEESPDLIYFTCH